MNHSLRILPAFAAVWLVQPAAAMVPAPHSQIVALEAALPHEHDPERRSAILNSLDRWRAIEIDPAGRYLLVNIPAFEISLWDHGERLGVWRAIVGKPSTPTPEFTTVASGAIVNPWWDVPASIVHESVGRLVARSPREAARRGYVKVGDRYRQRPGPNNALGLMKLDMPNRFSVGIHDTPSKPLFEKTVRSFSHGCIRVDDALGFAAMLLGGGEEAKARVDKALKSGRTTRLPLAAPIPVVVGYFTAFADADSIAFYPDIYRRDAAIVRASVALPLSGTECAAG